MGDFYDDDNDIYMNDIDDIKNCLKPEETKKRLKRELKECRSNLIFYSLTAMASLAMAIKLIVNISQIQDPFKLMLGCVFMLFLSALSIALLSIEISEHIRLKDTLELFN